MKSEISPRPDRPYTGFDLRLANLAKFLIRHRRGAMVLQVIIFVACILGTLSLRLHDDPNAWPPRNDRFVQLNDLHLDPRIELAPENGPDRSPPYILHVLRLNPSVFVP